MRQRRFGGGPSNSFVRHMVQIASKPRLLDLSWMTVSRRMDALKKAQRCELSFHAFSDGKCLRWRAYEFHYAAADSATSQPKDLRLFYRRRCRFAAMWKRKEGPVGQVRESSSQNDRPSVRDRRAVAEQQASADALSVHLMSSSMSKELQQQPTITNSTPTQGVNKHQLPVFPERMINELYIIACSCSVETIAQAPPQEIYAMGFSKPHSLYSQPPPIY